MDLRRLLGNRGEGLAARYLETQGHVILERQFRVRFGEIDLVTRDGDEIVFVEVKLRRSTAHGFPEEVVTPTKLHRLEIAAEAYLQAKACERESYRFDVIAIIDRKPEPEIEHLMGV